MVKSLSDVGKELPGEARAISSQATSVAMKQAVFFSSIVRCHERRVFVPGSQKRWHGPGALLDRCDLCGEGSHSDCQADHS